MIYLDIHRWICYQHSRRDGTIPPTPPIWHEDVMGRNKTNIFMIQKAVSLMWAKLSPVALHCQANDNRHVIPLGCPEEEREREKRF
jgi:hypothetical protein